VRAVERKFFGREAFGKARDCLREVLHGRDEDGDYGAVVDAGLPVLSAIAIQYRRHRRIDRANETAALVGNSDITFELRCKHLLDHDRPESAARWSNHGRSIMFPPTKSQTAIVGGPLDADATTHVGESSVFDRISAELVQCH
jgi:hypothetical protein